MAEAKIGKSSFLYSFDCDIDDVPAAKATFEELGFSIQADEKVFCWTGKCQDLKKTNIFLTK